MVDLVGRSSDGGQCEEEMPSVGRAPRAGEQGCKTGCNRVSHEEPIKPITLQFGGAFEQLHDSELLLRWTV